MNRNRWIIGLLFVSGLTGCTPDGPNEFYREALQIKSEFVDALSFVADESTAKQYFDPAHKKYNSRMAEVRENLTAYRNKMSFDNAFRKMNREDFNAKKHIEADVLDALVVGMRAYQMYCENITFTYARIAREMQRIDLVIEASVAARMKDQLDQNQPVDANPSQFPNLAKVKTGLGEFNKTSLSLFNASVLPENLAKFDWQGVDIDKVFKFKQDDINVKIPGFEMPPPPARPAWIDEVYRRSGDRQKGMPMAAFAIQYLEADNLQTCKITNNSGKKFMKVQASYFWQQKGGGKGAEDASSQEWAAGETRDMPWPPRQPGLRWQGTAVGADGVTSRIDIVMPMPPAKKDG